MNSSIRVPNALIESNIASAIQAYQAKQYSSIRACARVFDVLYTTLRYRMAGRTSRANAHQLEQILSPAEEQVLVRYITRLTRTGFPATPVMVIEIAEEIRKNRIILTRSRRPSYTPIGKRWIDRFRERHPEIQGIWTRQIDNARYKAVNTANIERWFQAVQDLYFEHQYAPKHIYNMDESGFSVGTSQKSRALVNIREKSSWKVIHGRQEWITAIECISASGEALPPLLIFKAKYSNTGWIPPVTPPKWRFTTSNSGWTSDSHAFEWLRDLFQPETIPDGPNVRRLLIMDGHSSHITARFIAFCLLNAIDLLILPPHTSHITQPLDISVFAPLKQALAKEVDRKARLDSRRLPRVEWTEMYISAHHKAFNSLNIQSGWRKAGIWPLSPIEVLSTLRPDPATPPNRPSIPRTTTPFDLSLLDSSPPDGTELRQANSILNSELRENPTIQSPAKRYLSRLTQAYEMAHSELTTIRKTLVDQTELLNTRKTRKNGKRVNLEGRFIYSAQDVLEIAREAEEATAAKKSRKRRCLQSDIPELENEEEEIQEEVHSESEGSCIEVVVRKTNRTT